MAFRSARDNASDSDDAESTSSSSIGQRGASETNAAGGIGGQAKMESVEARYRPDAYPKSLKEGLYRQTKRFGPDRVGQWAEEGMRTETMGKPREMEEFRERQKARSPEVIKHIEQQNEASVHRSKKAQQDMGPSGDVGIPGSVRDVISSQGKNLDGDVRSGLEDRLGTSLDHVQIHTGPKAQQACEEVNARAFAVGNHIAFGPGEYNPSSAEGQHLIAHEVVHTLQQPDAEMSMMPKADLDVEIDPDPKAEREADQIAGEVMKGGEVGMHSSWQTDVHVQRMGAGVFTHWARTGEDPTTQLKDDAEDAAAAGKEKLDETTTKTYRLTRGELADLVQEVDSPPELPKYIADNDIEVASQLQDSLSSGTRGAVKGWKAGSAVGALAGPGSAVAGGLAGIPLGYILATKFGEDAAGEIQKRLRDVLDLNTDQEFETDQDDTDGLIDSIKNRV